MSVAKPSGAGAGTEPRPAGSAQALEPEALARRIVALVDAKKGEDVLALDMRPLVGYTDFMVVATARNERQAKAIHDEVRERLKRDHGLLPARVEGQGQGWVLMDYVDCVLHVLVPELRERYRLERLWAEAPRLETTE